MLIIIEEITNTIKYSDIGIKKSIKHVRRTIQESDTGNGGRKSPSFILKIDLIENAS